MFARTAPKNMNHDIAEVHEDPVTGFGSFEAVQAMPFFRQCLVYVVLDGQNLTFGVGRADDEEVRHPGRTRNV